MRPLRLLLLASGRGSHVANLIDATRDGRLEGTVARVVSDQADAAALDEARARGVPTAVLAPFQPGPRLAPEAETELLTIIREDRPNLIALCGFMRLLRATTLERAGAPILNVHPSLLPSFPGLNSQRRAIEAGAVVTGATVHKVDTGIDTGPIVLQEPLSIRSGETPEELAERLLPLEHSLYVKAIRKMAEEEL
jgi:phosphoribosylglycinamide formyltransferase 1